MEDWEFAICYRKLIAQYCLPPEEADRQLAAILHRIGVPGCEAQKEMKRETCSGGIPHENKTAGNEA